MCINIALLIIVGFFFLRTLYAFYMGFRYYNTHFTNDNTSEVKQNTNGKK